MPQSFHKHHHERAYIVTDFIAEKNIQIDFKPLLK